MNETKVIKWLAKGIAFGVATAYTIVGVALHIFALNPGAYIKQDSTLVFSVTEKDVVSMIEGSSGRLTIAIVVIAVICIVARLVLTHNKAFEIKEKQEK